MITTPQRPGVVRVATLILACLTGACTQTPAPSALREPTRDSPVLSPADAMASFRVAPGYRVELVAAEPLVSDPVAIDFDPDGRMYVVEMRGYMPNLDGTGENRPVGRVVVLEDRDDDGRMDQRTVFLDSLVLPRAVKVTTRGVLVAAPPYLWLARDRDGDLRADSREVVREDYGDPAVNPEHNANGLYWGIDNLIHNADYDGAFRLRDGRFQFVRTPGIGQWGVTSDDYGRLFRNANESPLHVDLVPAAYFGRDTVQRRTRGIYERVIANGPVWPVRPTPGVNRGYQERTLRDDSTLAHFTAAGSPVVYRGDRFPRDVLNNVFVTEPAGNLVRRFVVTDTADGMLTARNAYEGMEFLASTDERFRPVNLHSAPDGTLYVIDMYRGIIQHRRYITDYLAEQIRSRNLEQPIGLGRIYRIVHGSSRRGPRPRLSGRSSSELVRTLTHSNGWWRQTAQQLLVERGDRSVAPALERLAQRHRDVRVRLHALWTLDGIAAVRDTVLRAALRDRSEHVRAAAVRIAARGIAAGNADLRAELLSLADDGSPTVRRHLSGALGDLPRADRIEALKGLLVRFPEDPIVVDLAVASLQGDERAMLATLLDLPGDPPTQPVAMLVASLLQSRRPEDVTWVLSWIGDETRPRGKRLALLGGVEAALPRSGFRGAPQRTLNLPSEPGGLILAARSSDPEIREAAAKTLPLLSWPGKPQPPGSEGPAPLTPAEQARFARGERLYATNCAGCHQPSGQGMAGVAKPLVGSPWVLARANQLIRIVLHGKEGDMLMPPMGGGLTDDEVAAVLTYIRRAWGNTGSAVTPEEVRETRGYTGNRTRPWTDEELRRAPAR